jgi:hypothetical protein
VKSRAAETHIQYNLLADEAGGTGSYEIDVPQGGLTYVIGNSIEQSDAGAFNGNPIIIAYSEESATAGPNPIQELFVANNTIVNDSNIGTFLNAVGSPQVTLVNNIYHGAGATPPGGTTNWTDAQGDPMLLDPATYDYVLQPGSPCIDAGTDPGSGDGQPLEPVAQYLPDGGAETRDDSHWDIGAFEAGDLGTPILGDGGIATSAGSTGSTGSTSSPASGSTSGSTSGGGSSTGGTSSGSTGGSTPGSTSGAAAGASSGAASGGAPDGGTAQASGGCGCGSDSGGGPVWAVLLGLLLWPWRPVRAT